MKADIKSLSILVAFLLTVGGIGAKVGKLQTETVQAKTEVEKVREEVKEAKEKINTEENINIKQSIMLENTAKILERIEAKL